MKKRYPPFKLHIGHAVTLHQRLATGAATPTEAERYGRIMCELRRKYANGQLSSRTARQFGIG